MIFPAEWAPQSFIQLTWPHENTDWADILEEVNECYINMAREIAKRQQLLIVTPEPEKVRKMLQDTGAKMCNITFAECPTNDTWARDHAFLTTTDDEGNLILNDFMFNGWGMKFAANHDNRINRNILISIQESFPTYTNATYKNRNRWVLEGGSVESDGEGTILTTESCLLAENRNFQDIEDREEVKKRTEDVLKESLGAERVLWLKHSWLAGDDTDGHIDTVARFCSPSIIAYTACDDQTDEHYEILHEMGKELKEFRQADGTPYTLVPLPLPDAVYDEDNERLPATYANFLIMDSAVLLPVYSQPEKDDIAIRQIKKAFPDKEIVPIECSVLVKQHGSLHCSTMQYPA